MATETKSLQFNLADYIIFSVTIATSLAVGIYYSCTGGKQKSASEFLFGDRKLSVIPVTLSLIATVISPITILGGPAEVYLYGLQYVWFLIAIAWPALMCACLYPSLFHPLKLNSVLEYYEKRYESKLLRIIAHILALFAGILYCGVMLYGPSIALENVMGYSFWIPMTFIITLSTVYTAIGGMKAVIISDVLQSGTMLIGLVVVIVIGTIKVNSVSRVIEILNEGGRLNFLENLEVDPTQRQNIWILSFGMCFINIAKLQTQEAVQRYTGVSSTHKAALVIVLYTFGCVFLTGLSFLAGAVVYAYYADIGCDPLQSGQITNANQLVPYFVMDVINYPGVPGIFMAALVSASLSSISSKQNAYAGIIWEDIMKNRGIFKGVTPAAETLILKLLVILVGLFSIAAAFIAWMIGGTLFKIISILGTVPLAILASMLLAGACFPCVSSKSTIISASIAMVLVVWLQVGSLSLQQDTNILPTTIHNCSENILSPSSQYINSTTSMNYGMNMHNYKGEDSNAFTLRYLYRISHLLYASIGGGITFVLSVILSFFPCLRHKSHVPNRYLFNFVRCCRKEKKLIEDDIKDEANVPLYSEKVAEKMATITSSSNAENGIAKGHHDSPIWKRVSRIM